MANRAAQRRHQSRASDPHKQLASLLRSFQPRHHLYTVFCHFVEMGAIAFSNAADKTQRDQREARYLEIVGIYQPDEIDRFAHGLALLTMALEEGPSDVLGSLYMLLELGSEGAGQFFTPYEVSELIARMLLTDPREQIERSGFVDLTEPACGAGGMVAAVAETMRRAGCNPQLFLHATCTDIALPCVHMAHLQLSLLHIPAVILHGNALSLEVWSVWRTPAHILGGWRSRLTARREAPELIIHAADKSAPATSTSESGDSQSSAGPRALLDKAMQLGLF